MSEWLDVNSDVPSRIPSQAPTKAPTSLPSYVPTLSPSGTTALRLAHLDLGAVTSACVVALHRLSNRTPDSGPTVIPSSQPTGETLPLDFVGATKVVLSDSLRLTLCTAVLKTNKSTNFKAKCGAYHHSDSPAFHSTNELVNQEF